MSNLAPILYSEEDPRNHGVAETINADAAPSLNAAFEQIHTESGIKPIVLRDLGGARTEAQQAHLVDIGLSDTMNSDHREDFEGRAAADIDNHRALRNWNESRFLAIMAAHGWHNMTNSGNPFPTEPWHFAIHAATPADTGTSTPISNPTNEDDDMRIQNFKLGDQDFFYYPDGTLFHSPDAPHTTNLQNWYQVNQLGAFNEAQVNVLFSGNSSLVFADAFNLKAGARIKKP